MLKKIDSLSFAKDVAKYILDTAVSDLKEKGHFTISLCGGNTPKPVYRELALIGGSLDWNNITITFGDERSVGPDHPDSNYRMVSETLLNSINIPSQRILRMMGELEPKVAAEKYEKQLRELAEKRGENIFVHDLILLGLGNDGHSASLFPDTSAITESNRWVVENHVAKLNSDRVTFTYPLINSSCRVCFLVNDSEKIPLVDSILNKSGDYPASKVKGVEETVWFVGI